MARTKQTARKSKGGVAPRRAIAIKAARKTRALPTVTYEIREGQTGSHAERKVPAARAAEFNLDDSAISSHMDNLWDTCGRSDIPSLRMVDEDSFKIVFAYYATVGDIYAFVSRVDLWMLFGKQISDFVSDPECGTFDTSRAYCLSLSE